MFSKFWIQTARTTSIAVCTLSGIASTTYAQNGSLYQRGTPQSFQLVRAQMPEQIAGQNPQVLPPAAPPPGMTFQPPEQPIGNPLLSSWTYTPPVPARQLRVHDIVFIRVEETSQSIAQGNSTSRKNTSYNASIKDWIRFVGLDTIKPDPQSDGDPTVQSVQSEVYRGDSTMRTSESMTFNIAAKIADIRPNGTIVLEARRTIRNNDNTWQAALSGVCRAQDIGPDNVILSRNIYGLEIDKGEAGHVRDGYSRGWLTKLLARVKPF